MKEAGGVVRLPDGAGGADIEPCKSGKQRLICGNATIVDVILRRQDEARANGSVAVSSEGDKRSLKKRKTPSE